MKVFKAHSTPIKISVQSLFFNVKLNYFFHILRSSVWRSPRSEEDLHFGSQEVLQQEDHQPAIDYARSERPPASSFDFVLLKTKGAKQQKQVMNKTAVRNLKAAKKKFDKHYARSSKPVIVDLAAGKKYARVCQDYVPTLLAGRCASSAYYWLQDCMVYLILFIEN